MNDNPLAQLIVKAAWFDLYAKTQMDIYQIAMELDRARQEIAAMKQGMAAEWGGASSRPPA